MSVAIRTATRIVDQDDVNVTLGAGVDEYALCWDNDTARFVLRAVAAGVTDHGALTGLTDDDHAGYALLAGRAGGQTLYGGNAANDDITIHGTSNATRTTSYVLLQPTAGNVGIGTSAPTALVHIYPASGNLLLTMSRPASTVHSVVQFDTADTPSGTDPRYLLGLLQNNKFFSIARWNGGLLVTDVSILTNGTVSVAGLLGIGTSAPNVRCHVFSNTATTSSVVNLLTVGHDTTGTAANGFGAGQLFQLESSTTAAQDAARIRALWYEATHATRKADLVLSVYDAAGEREGLRVRGDGTGPALGFYGVSPVARAVLATGAGATVDNVITALQNLGLVKQS